MKTKHRSRKYFAIKWVEKQMKEIRKCVNDKEYFMKYIMFPTPKL